MTRVRRVCRLLTGLSIILLTSTTHGYAQATSQTLGDDLRQIKGPLSLQGATRRVVAGSSSVRAMESEHVAAMFETRALRAMSRPQLSATTFLSAASMPNILNTTPGVSPATALIVPDRSFVDQNLTLMVPLYTGGTKSNLVKAASLRERAAFQDVGTAELDAIYLVKEAYFRALLAAESIKVAEARVNAATALVEVTRAQVEAGKGIQASEARAASELAAARRTLANTRNDQQKAFLDLKRAIGVRWDSDITLSDALSIATPAGDIQANLAEASRLHPELLAARARVDAARALTAAAKGTRKPQIYGTVMADAFAPRDGMKNVGGVVGVTMSIPLMDSGERAAEISRTQALERRNEAELKGVELRIATEIRQARLDIDTAAENYRAAEAVVESSQAAYDVIAVRVENQKSILVEQLDALAALTEARANLAQALFDHSIAVARLDRAIGRF